MGGDGCGATLSRQAIDAGETPRLRLDRFCVSGLGFLELSSMPRECGTGERDQDIVGPNDCWPRVSDWMEAPLGVSTNGRNLPFD